MTPTHQQDMQAILGAGFAQLRHGDYWLLRVHDRTAARSWLAAVLATGAIPSVADLGLQKRTDTAMLAFTYRGLRRLGVRDTASAPFPTPFRAAMTGSIRRQLLRDGPLDDWSWGDMPWQGRHERHVDLLLAHYRDSARTDPTSPLHPDHFANAGLTVVQQLRSCPSYVERQHPDGTRLMSSEPFGFADGISQPVLEGMPMSGAQQRARQAAGGLYDDRVVAPGEFILGHRNEYGETAYCPDVAGWPADGTRFGFNGSYLVVRQILQDVAAFRRFDESNPATAGQPALVEKMIGRRRDGTPLIVSPQAPSEIDAFRYRQDDLEGLQCPRGAHVRRTNPRDTLGWSIASGVQISKLHRLLRRGRTLARDDRPCQQAGKPGCDDPVHRQSCGEGLFFMAFNADLDRQFEFIQQRWIGNKGFGDLANEDDPALGPSAQRAFSVPALPTGERIEHFDRFTRTVGGGYFFLPGLKALHFMAQSPKGMR